MKPILRPPALLVAVLALLAVVCAAACDTSKPKVRFLVPVDGAELTLAPFDVHLDLAPSAQTATLRVELNGSDVTAAFVVEAPGSGRIDAWADALWEPGLLQPGPNQLVARVELGSGAEVEKTIAFDAVGDPFADAVASFVAGSGGGFGQGSLPGIVLGAPLGAGLFEGGLDVVSLGVSGSIELDFVDNVVVDGPGVDLTIFENAFLELVQLVTQPPFSEPARVSVSQDGVQWLAFPCALDPAWDPYYPGCAGVYPVLSNALEAATPHASLPSDTPIQDLVGQNALLLVAPPGSGGDSFDLAELGLGWVRHVRIESADFSTGPVGSGNAGFDLDAVAAVHSAPATDADQNGIPDAVE